MTAKLQKSFESPVTVFFAEDHLEFHGLPGGRLKVPIEGSLDVTLDGYIVQVRVARRAGSGEPVTPVRTAAP
jgi:hypothetical protein